MRPKFKHIRHQRLRRFRHSDRFLRWLAFQASRVGLSPAALYSTYIRRGYSARRIEALAGGGGGGGGSAINYAQSEAYFSAASPITGTDSAVTGITNLGKGGWNLGVAGTGNAITRDATGFAYSNGIRNSASITARSGIDGVFLVVRATIASYSGAPAFVFAANPASALINIYDNNGALQARYHDGATRTIALGATPYGTEFVVGIELDPRNNRVRTYDIARALASVTPAAAPNVAFNTVILGQAMTGRVHEATIWTRPTGGDYAATFEQVLADF